LREELEKAALCAAHHHLRCDLMLILVEIELALHKYLLISLPLLAWCLFGVSLEEIVRRFILISIN
jgi:hypothetical protein